jgi:hypothetical protein
MNLCLLIFSMKISVKVFKNWGLGDSNFVWRATRRQESGQVWKLFNTIESS